MPESGATDGAGELGGRSVGAAFRLDQVIGARLIAVNAVQPMVRIILDCLFGEPLGSTSFLVAVNAASPTVPHVASL